LTPSGHVLPQMIESVLAKKGKLALRGGMSFWTDAAILGDAGIPSVVFGPRGAGLHSVSEYVIAEDVITCREVLIELAKEFCCGR